MGCYYHIRTKGFSYDLQLRHGSICSSTLLRFNKVRSLGAGRLDKVMAVMKFPVVALAEDKFQVSVDINLYAKEVLTAAIYGPSRNPGAYVKLSRPKC